MSWLTIESDGPIPGDYSMICFGAVIVEPELNRTFYGKLKHLQKTRQTHNPVDDARGNAEALLQMKEMGLKIRFESLQIADEQFVPPELQAGRVLETIESMLRRLSFRWGMQPVRPRVSSHSPSARGGWG